MATAELTGLITRLAQGEVEAADELLQEFGPIVLRTIRMRLGEKLRRDFDSVDFVQAVWESFFEHPERLSGFEDPKALCAYLVRMAERKILMAARRAGRLKRGGDRRLPFDSTLAESSKLAGREATPSQLAVAEETWRRLLAGRSYRDQRILYLRNAGHSRVEIADLLGVADSTVRRVLDELKKFVVSSQ